MRSSEISMGTGLRNNLLLLLMCFLPFSGALSYDYKASIECLETPLEPQYNGGIVKNPEINEGLEGWSTLGGGRIEHRRSAGGNNFIVAHTRSHQNDSFTQKFYLHSHLLYTFSAWVQVSSGDAVVSAVFKTGTGYVHASAVVAESGCWSMLKGGLTVDSSGPAELFFQNNATSIETWVDSISLQPFTKEQWRSHQDQSMEKVRKKRVRLQATGAGGEPLAGAKVSIEQKKLGFPFGCAINKNILTNTAYQNWFTSKFTVTTFENEMKWYSTEAVQGREDYSVPDAMLAFAKSHGVAVRGHNIVWDDPHYQPGWVNSLSRIQLAAAVKKRVTSVVSRYRGQLIAWDAVNENLHFSFFESKLGPNFTPTIYRAASQLDRGTTLFLNEYNTIEESGDGASSPTRYLAKLREIQASGGAGSLGIGLESHFKTPNIPYVRSALDTLAATGLPIWITELDVQSGTQQSWYLEQVLREVQAHPAVKGIVLWASWTPQGCYRMCLTDNNFKNLATGDVVDKILWEWGRRGSAGETDEEGFFETSLFHGDYDVKISHPAKVNSSLSHNFMVDSTATSPETTQFLKVSV